MRVLVSGGTGLVGRRLLEGLTGSVVLSRNAERARRSLEGLSINAVHAWDPTMEPVPTAAWNGVDAVVHLAGESVAKRWTPAVKKAIRDSRVLSTRHLVDSMERCSVRPKVLVCASAVGLYGDRGDEELTEGTTPGSGFLAEVCQEWEAEALRARNLGVRVVLLRTGIVLDPAGGALGQMLPLFRWGLGGRLGSGKQWMPWIHRDDEIGLIRASLDRDDWQGAVNAASPGAVRNVDFTRALAKTLGRPAWFPAPGFALRMALGEFAADLVASQRVVPAFAQQKGFEFAFGEVEAAFCDLLR